MADIANIGFRADTSELSDAKASMEALAPAAAKADAAVEKLAGATDNAAAAAARGTTANNNLRAATVAETGALTQAAAAANRAASANDNLSASAGKAGTAVRGLQGQVGNISAQFGDIAVQLAGGQSPFQIALQQGLQLTGIFGGQGLGAVVRGLGGAFMSLLSPMSLITVATIALGGYALQYFMDLVNGGEQAKLSLADQDKLIRNISSSWGEAVPAIQAYVAELDRAAQAADAANAAEAIRAKMTAETTATIENLNVQFADLLYSMNTLDSTNPVIQELNSAFANLRDKVAEGKATQEDFNAVLDAAQSASFNGISGIDAFIKSVTVLMGAALKTAGAVAQMNAQISAASNTALNNPASWRGATNNNANGGDNNPIQGGDFPELPYNGVTPESRPLIELQGLPGQFKADGSLAGAKGGGGGSSAAKLKTELEGINQALQNLNEPFNQASTAYNTLQNAMKNGTIDNQQYEQSLKEIEAAFKAAGGTSDQWANVVTQNTKKVAGSLDEAKGIVKGFFSDFMNGIRQGKSIWESFADAANNALNKIIDKLLNNLIDAIFTVNKATGSAVGGGGGGGIFQSLFGWLGGIFSAKGNVFDQNGVTPFAKGGVVSNPTMFNYAGGVGVMGEKGSEAIVPLKRGPDGSLGIQMHGSAANSNVANNITIAPVINTPQSTGNAAQDQKNAENMSKAVTDSIRQIVDERIIANSRYGGSLNPRGYGNK